MKSRRKNLSQRILNVVGLVVIVSMVGGGLLMTFFPPATPTPTPSPTWPRPTTPPATATPATTATPIRSPTITLAPSGTPTLTTTLTVTPTATLPATATPIADHGETPSCVEGSPQERCAMAVSDSSQGGDAVANLPEGARALRVVRRQSL